MRKEDNEDNEDYENNVDNEDLKVKCKKDQEDYLSHNVIIAHHPESGLFIDCKLQFN